MNGSEIKPSEFVPLQKGNFNEEEKFNEKPLTSQQASSLREEYKYDENYYEQEHSKEQTFRAKIEQTERGHRVVEDEAQKVARKPEPYILFTDNDSDD